MYSQKIAICVGIGMLILFAIVIVFALVKIKDTLKILNEIANDTLKRADSKGVLRWSRTSLTMLTAWIVSLYMAGYDMYKNGFHTEVFLTLVGVALGSKVADGFSKKLDPTVVAPPVVAPPVVAPKPDLDI